MEGIALFASLLVFACVTMYFSGFLIWYVLLAITQFWVLCTLKHKCFAKLNSSLPKSWKVGDTESIFVVNIVTF